MKVEVRNRVLHFIPESHNELVTAEWIIEQLRLVASGGSDMVIAKPEYPPSREVEGLVAE